MLSGWDYLPHFVAGLGDDKDSRHSSRGNAKYLGSISSNLRANLEGD